MGVKYSFPPSLHLSRDCVDLIARIFVGNPAHRITIAGIRKHPWFVKNLPAELADGGAAAAAAMARPTQSVDDVKRVVADARTRPGAPPPRDVEFDEERFMDNDLLDEEGLGLMD
jgi:serine/threonine-protein kinase SRK2